MNPNPRSAWRALTCLTLLFLWAGPWVSPRSVPADTRKAGSGGAATQEQEKEAEAPEDKTPKRSIRMKEMEIVGEVEKPKAMFVIPMAPIEYRRTHEEKDFTEEILAPINRNWIQDLGRQIEPASQP